MKGHHGETCTEAICSVIKPGQRFTFSELFKQIREKGDWRDETIWQDTMANIANLPPAKFHWKNAKPLLLLHEDGTFELYDPKHHAQIRE